jgi:hypothetical protein
MTRSAVVLLAVSMVAACGPGAAPNVVNVSTIAVQTADLPNGMTRCDISGDIDTYINNIKAKDPATYTSTKTQWDAAKTSGAVAAQVAFFTDSAANCANIKSAVSNLSAATYQLVVNFVIQFKDEASAAAAYTNDKIFGIDKSALSATTPVVQGAKTGLGPNSLVLSYTLASQSFYIAIWQKKAFMVILGIINVDTVSGQKAADAENKRIH